MVWDLPVENVIGIAVFLLTELGVEPENNRSGSALGRSINCSLFRTANVSSIKQCEDPESNSATNGRAFTATAAEVRERRKAFGVMEVVLSRITGAALPLLWQPFKSTMLERLPSSFPSLPQIQVFEGQPLVCGGLWGSSALHAHLSHRWHRGFR